MTQSPAHRHWPSLLAFAAVALASPAASAADAPATKAAAVASPADLLGGLKRWHLTLPTSTEKKAFPADQVDQPQLASYASEFFKLNDDKTAVVFTTIVGGATTSAGTAFARTELRERDVQGEKAAWNCASDVRSMSVRQRILKTPRHKPEMSVGQIHDAKNDNLEVFYRGPEKNVNGSTDVGTMVAKFNGEAASKAPVLDDSYRVGDMMQVTVSTKAGVMTVDYRNERSGKTASASRPFEGVIGGCFFKAGNYPQACTKTNIYGVENPNCSKKQYRDEQFETDPQATAVLEIHSLSLD